MNNDHKDNTVKTNQNRRSGIDINVSGSKKKQEKPEPQPDKGVEEYLYQKHEKIYSRKVSGVFARLRVIAVLILLGLFYGLAWLNWDGHQAILFNLPERKFYLFGITLWPQDFFYLATLLIICALGLFYVTALAGRVWCGYACPQTVWTETFLWIERKIEGDRAQQMKLAKQPWNREKILKVGTKQLVWILYALWTGFTFVGYFTPIRELGPKLLTFSAGYWEYFWVFFYGFATYGNAGWMREQVCLYMCPYARFQSAMFDKNTLIISYDEARGEPRGGRKRGVDPKESGLGDCIGCTLCVQVCPTGIDIRDGLQYECISCAACIDACNDVMDKMEYPRGLIRYTTENALEGNPTKIIRPRTIMYTLILIGLVLALAYSIWARIPLRVDIDRDRNVLFRQAERGLISNSYNMKILNMDQRAHTYRLSVDGIEDAILDSKSSKYTLNAGEILNIPISIKADPAYLPSTSNDVNIIVESIDNPNLRVVKETRFLGPGGL